MPILSFGALLPFEDLSLPARSLLDFAVTSQSPQECQGDQEQRLQLGWEHEPQKVSDSAVQECSLGSREELVWGAGQSCLGEPGIAKRAERYLMYGNHAVHGENTR